MRRRVELEKSAYIASTRSNRNVENQTRDFCRIDEISRQKAIKEQLLKEQIEQEELDRRRLRANAERERQTQLEVEKAKAAQLIEDRRLAVCDKKTRQRLREECEELRLLEGQLRTAYVAKENAYQIGERRARELQEKVSNKTIKFNL